MFCSSQPPNLSVTLPRLLAPPARALQPSPPPSPTYSSWKVCILLNLEYTISATGRQMEASIQDGCQLSRCLIDVAKITQPLIQKSARRQLYPALSRAGKTRSGEKPARPSPLPTLSDG